MSDSIRSNILILSNEQFGYLVDYYYYVKYLSSIYNITFICPDDNLTKVTDTQADIRYLKQCNGIKRRIEYRNALKSLIDDNSRFDMILIGIKGGMILYDLLRKLSSVIVNDIRTLDISNSTFIRKAANLLIKFESSQANHTTVISELVADKLKLQKGHYTIIPLGGNLIDCPPKRFDQIRLIYVGTFLGRNLEDTIDGTALFVSKHPELRDKLHYDIIGDGAGKQTITDSIKRHRLGDIVKMHGYIPNNLLGSYLSEANVGVSYIPINDKYDLQHPTKTYEYLCAGMPVIATATAANKEIINAYNGITIQDNSEDFCIGLESILANRDKYDSDAIKKGMENYTWEHIVKSLRNLIEHKCGR